MSGTKSKSAVPVERERLLPPALVLTFTAIVGVGLALMFPRETLRERLLGQGRTVDGLTVAYLEAWWRAAPDDISFMSVLAEQYARSGRLDDAEAMLARMQAVQGVDLSGQILRTQIDIAEQHAYAEPPESARREQYLAHMRELIGQAVQREWSQADLQQLATLARQVHASDAAMYFYRKLARVDRNHAEFWNRQLAEIALAGGDYRASARALFEQQARATSLADQRSLFLKALQTLQAGNLLDEALAEAERHGGRLLDDPQTLRYLTKLALAANHSDLASRYVERLLRVTSHRPTAQALAARQAARNTPDHPWAARGVIFLDGPRGLALRQALADADEFGVRKTATNAPAAAAGARLAQAPQPFNADDHDLAYRVFLADGKLNEAQRVAETVVRRMPDSALWRERLAQVAEWNQHPDVALQSWLAYARASGDERAWNHVLRLAPGLSDDRAYLAALQHRARSGDLKTVDEVVAAYERLGEPQDAMAFLSALSHGPNAREIIERHAQLAERAGKDERAFQLYTELQQRFGPRPAYALKLANLLYVRGKLEPALNAMLPAREKAEKAGRADIAYWRTFTELARLNGRDDLLGDGYRQLMAGMVQTRDDHCMRMPPGAGRNDCLDEQRDTEASDVSSLIAFYDKSPIDAGRIAEASWRRSARRNALELALYYYTRAHAYARIQTLLQGLDAEQRQDAEHSARFLMHRAEYLRLTGDRASALADLRRAAGLPDANSETLAALLWALIDQGTNTEVRALMRRLQGEAEDSPELWGAYAAGHMRFQDGRSALHYLRKMAQGKSADPLWLGLNADAFEAIGQTDTAWRIRRQAWIDLHHDWAEHGARGRHARADLFDGDDGEENDQGTPSRGDLRREVVSLGRIFASADVSRALVRQMLRADRAAVAARELAPPVSGAASQLGDVPGLPPLNPARAAAAAKQEAVLSAAGRETALAWALSGESNELARAWLARHYARQLLRPAYAEIAIALDQQDLDALDRILERQAGRVPVASKIEANLLLGRLAAGQTSAFETQDVVRTDDSLQGSLEDALLFNAQAIEPRAVFSHQKPLEFYDYSVAGGVRLWDGYDLNLRGQWRAQRSTDPAQLVNVPSSDRRAELSLGYRDTQKRWRATVGYREGLDTMATGRFFGEWNQQGRLAFTTLAGLNQPADESAALRVGGAKDVLGLGVTYRLGLREFVGARVEYSSFRGQDRSALGHGMVYDVEAGYRIRTAYPDYTVRIVGTHASYSANGGSLTPLMAALVPAGVAATPGFYMPQGFTQAGVLFGFGTELIDEYTRKWRPFGEVGLLHDTRARQNFRVQAGVAGSVFGNDHLSLYVSHETAARNGGVPLTEVGLRYRWLY
jgi:hypothetical protein